MSIPLASDRESWITRLGFYDSGWLSGARQIVSQISGTKTRTLAASRFLIHRWHWTAWESGAAWIACVFSVPVSVEYDGP